ncbi:hypothetical protein D3H55_08960 [Bacillus salacetis]|uniref:Uncharacterized protein n=1 Tax=Bacillus salacetis TaxID=2315464 RepID=A0A3A1R321_9BACI|nr:hypothetical protein [Bacillus salacetis]RIW34634.1 hypothetical protein D3H55_08960 [Bacillus salacetis]
MKRIQSILETGIGLLLGLLFIGSAYGPDDYRFGKTIRRLKKENWFKQLSDNGYYFEKIYHNPETREFLLQENIVERLKENEREREYFVSLIKESSRLDR